MQASATHNVAENAGAEPTAAVTSLSGNAIVLSGWDWPTNNVPERIATALARVGWRVLHCENPASFLRRSREKRIALDQNVEGFRPKFVGHRLNWLPCAQRLQGKLLANQILEQARQAGMERPIVIFPHGYWVGDVVRELKARGLFLIYVCMDHPETGNNETLAALSDLILVIPQTVFHQLSAKWGDKVHRIPQFGPDLAVTDGDSALGPALDPVEQIPRPRLGYLGRPVDRLHSGLVGSVFESHPEWHFVACGPVPGVRLPNLHQIRWTGSRELARVCRALDVGFMPYNCHREFNLHCVPLKLFDYFAAALPVVSTPIIHLWEYGDLVYLGDTAAELSAAIQKALAEAPDDPRREERRRIARAHSTERLSEILSSLLSPEFGRHGGVRS